MLHCGEGRVKHHLDHPDGFVAGLTARMLSPGPNDPKGFILTTVLGIAGAFFATGASAPRR